MRKVKAAGNTKSYTVSVQVQWEGKFTIPARCNDELNLVEEEILRKQRNKKVQYSNEQRNWLKDMSFVLKTAHECDGKLIKIISEPKHVYFKLQFESLEMLQKYVSKFDGIWDDMI